MTLSSITDRIRDRVASCTPGYSLPQAFYTDPEIYALDLENVFYRYWLFAGHVSQIPRAGEYFTYSLSNEFVIVFCDDDAGFHALYTVCSHRVLRICSSDAGHAKRLICPYHAWMYDKNGTLNSAARMPKVFDTSSFGLHRPHC